MQVLNTGQMEKSSWPEAYFYLFCLTSLKHFATAL
jgi:hypothetical protein